MLILADGQSIGMVSAGCLEKALAPASLLANAKMGQRSKPIIPQPIASYHKMRWSMTAGMSKKALGSAVKASFKYYLNV